MAYKDELLKGDPLFENLEDEKCPGVLDTEKFSIKYMETCVNETHPKSACTIYKIDQYVHA